MTFPIDEQRYVINHMGNPLVVIAGPGTGKTKTLVHRMMRLLSEDPTREISFITFTRTSRRDADNKLEQSVGRDILEDDSIFSPRVSTLHTYAKSLLHRYARYIDRRSTFSILIIKKGEKDLIIKEIIDDLELDLDPNVLGDAVAHFRCKSYWPDLLQLSEDQRTQVIESFESFLSFYNTFDMEGVVFSACRILQLPDVVLPPIFLQVDEYQDLNLSDQLFIRLLASNKDSQVVVVGDDAQSIYSFRHAHYQGLRDLWNSQGWQTIRFSDSIRMPSYIQNASLALIANEVYLGAQLNPKPDDRRRVLTLQCTKPDIQVRAIAKLINDFRSNRSKRDGEELRYSDFMVLCPAGTFVRTCVRILSEDFGIPAIEVSRPSIPSELWELLLILRMLHLDDPLALRQWLVRIMFDDSEIASVRRLALSNQVNLFEHCKSHDDPRLMSLYEAIRMSRDEATTLESFIDAVSSFPGLSLSKLELKITLDSITQKEDEALDLGKLIHLIYESYGLLESDIEVPEQDSVLVTTLHSAKGLEAEFVFLCWMNKKYIPQSNRDVSEERRLLYVGMTRAMQELIFTFHEVFKGGGRRLYKLDAMSPFLHEITDYLNINRIRASDLS